MIVSKNKIELIPKKKLNVYKSETISNYNQ